MYEADKRDQSALHDFNELMPDQPRVWHDETYEDLQAIGFLHRASGETFGGPFGRLSSHGRRYVEGLPPPERKDVTIVVEASARPFDDQHFRFKGGTVIVRVPIDQGQPWLLTWLPDAEEDPSYPGFTVTPEDMEFPTAYGVGGILEWAARQPWTRRAAGEDVDAPAPTEARIGEPTEEYVAFSKRVHLDFGWHFGASPEPDGSFTWVVMSEDGLQVKSGMADTWDDARIAAFEHLYPPSDEQ